MEIQLKEFNPNQQKQVKDFILQVWKEFGFVYMQEYDFDLDDPEKFYIQPGGMFYVLYEGNNIIGTIGIINKNNHVAELKRFYVDINFRKKGYGTQLYDKALKFCQKNGIKKIEIETGKAFKQGHKFYISKGFNILKEDEESYYMERFI